MWLTEGPFAIVPSPKSQVKVYGEMPPEAVVVNVTACPGEGEEGVVLKVTIGGET